MLLNDLPDHDGERIAATIEYQRGIHNGIRKVRASGLLGSMILRSGRPIKCSEGGNDAISVTGRERDAGIGDLEHEHQLDLRRSGVASSWLGDRAARKSGTPGAEVARMRRSALPGQLQCQKRPGIFSRSWSRAASSQVEPRCTVTELFLTVKLVWHVALALESNRTCRTVTEPPLN